MVTFAQIFVNQETTETYKRVMEYFFTILRDRYRIITQWQHLHGTGFHAMIMDQDSKQFSGLMHFKYIVNILLIYIIGFSRYLTSIDPQSRNWHWQMQHSVVFCQIHFKRGVERVVGSTDKSPTSMYAQMIDLPNSKSKEEYYHFCDLIIGNIF